MNLSEGGFPVATTVRLLVAERRKFIRNLKPLFRRVDGSIEAIEREIVRILKRKLKVPEPDDILRLLSHSAEILKNLDKAITELKKGYIV